MKRIKPALILLILLPFLPTSCKEKTADATKEKRDVITSLPYLEVALENLQEFSTKGSNWKIVGNVSSNFNKKHDLQIEKGKGVLVNTNAEENNSHLFSTFEHGDIELDIEFMIPKGSNSGIYFQSRYEIQLFDSWGIKELSAQDCGSIYQRWDDTKPEGEKGYEGHPPKQNATKAPGLWQHLHVKFRAPRFDTKGVKTANARFEEVLLNGVKIHSNVEITGPTRAASATKDSEVAKAPLMIQGDHGPVAFRNMNYKLYYPEKLSTANIKYDYYEVGTPVSKLPNIDSLQVVDSGITDTINIDKLSKRRDGVVLRFTSTLNVPKDGDYLFHLYSDDGSKLYIDSTEVVDHDGNHEFLSKTGLINLKKGVHHFQLDYFNNIWGRSLALDYEGPEQELQTLAGVYPYGKSEAKKPMLIDANGEPEMIRSFVNYHQEKRTHVISVGDPRKINYTYDLKSGALLKVWKGGFANVTRMWRGRGIQQILIPQNMALELNENVLATKLNNKKTMYPLLMSEKIKPMGYSLNAAMQPVFKFQSGNTQILDNYAPSKNGTELERTIKVKGDDTLYTRAGFGTYIQKINEDYYVIDGSFYLSNIGDNKPFIRDIDGKKELMYELKEGEAVKYSLLW